MYDQDRLQQMIRDAKIRREDHRKQELKLFQSGVQGLLGQELYGILEVRCELENAGDEPQASFRIGNARWAITRNQLEHPAGEPNWWLIDPRAEAIAVHTGDDVLLAIDEADKSQR